MRARVQLTANSAPSELNAISANRPSCYDPSCLDAQTRRLPLIGITLNPLAARPIFLIGYRGTGKTTVARLLAARLGWKSVDADDIIQQRFGQTIREIFDAEGEAGFRAKEAAVLDDLCKLSRHVIA